jgi:large subunit ribosomal protein L13
MVVIDIDNLIVGRVATSIAKQALLGEKVDVINCEKGILVGKKEMILTKYKEKKKRGNPLKGPFIPTMPDRFVRRIIRNMLPFKQDKGKRAFKNIMCYIGTPDSLKDKKVETIKKFHISNSKSVKYIRIGELCRLVKK